MRVKGGIVTRRRHKRMLQNAEGLRGRARSCFRIARRIVQKGWQYAYRDRRAKKRLMRQLWIARLNAGSRSHGLSYSRLIVGLEKAQIQIDRKVLSDICVRDPVAFGQIVEQAKRALAA